MGDSLVLTYHAVSPSWPCPLAVKPERLRRQIGDLIGRGYTAVTFAQLTRGDHDGNTLAITFDDGYLSVYEHALPILAELDVPATVFVPTALAGRPEPMAWRGIEDWIGTEHEHELLPLSWEQLGEMQRLGWEVGSHTRTHPRLTELSDSELVAELEGSREDCRRELGTPCTTLAFPYGDFDARVSSTAYEAGYSAVATMHPFGDGRFAWPRVGVYEIDGPWRFELKTSAPLRRLRRSRIGAALERARYSLTAVELAPLAEDVGAVAWAL